MFDKKTYEYKGQKIGRSTYREMGSAYNSSYGRFRRYSRLVTYYYIWGIDKRFRTLKETKTFIDEKAKH